MKRIRISRVFPTVILLICAVAFSGCGRKSDPPVTSQLQSADTTASAEEETNVMTVSSHADCLYNISDIDVLASVSEHIALIRIDSIDGTSNLNNQTGEYVSKPYLYGKATVLKELKGRFGTQGINFVREGGTLSYNEWIKGDCDPAKLQALREKASLDSENTDTLYVKHKPEGDIELEAGKIYLAYMFRNPDFNVENEYVIHGYQYGLRELRQNINLTDDISGLSDLKVKNNMTGEWEDMPAIATPSNDPES